MYESKTEMGQNLNMNPKDALNLKEMKKVMKGMLSYEHFVNLNVKIIQYEEKFIQQDKKINLQEERLEILGHFV